MYTVDHLVQQHLKQMEKLSRQQEKAARKREKQQLKLEEAFARFREELMPPLSPASPQSVDAEGDLPIVAPSSKKTGFIRILRTFLF